MTDYDQELAEQYRRAFDQVRAFTLTDGEANVVRDHREQARTYAWGRQDEAALSDSDEASNFANAYGVHAADYVMGRTATRLNLRRAWRRFKAGHPIGD